MTDTESMVAMIGIGSVVVAFVVFWWVCEDWHE